MTSTAAAIDSFVEERYLRYRLDVIALDVAGLVQAAGAWLYHRMAIGWEVTVAVPEQQDRRPLLILGVRTVDLETVLSAPAGEWTGHCLAVVAEAGGADARIHERVESALRHSRTEVVVWGDSWPLDRRLHPVRHVPTVAGRAFKRQALLAADPGIELPGGPELFRSDEKHGMAMDSDLVAVD